MVSKYDLIYLVQIFVSTRNQFNKNIFDTVNKS